MPHITDERRDVRREQILEAARACLQERGVEAVSMEMIVARSGPSTGAVYVIPGFVAQRALAGDATRRRTQGTWTCSRGDARPMIRWAARGAALDSSQR